MKKNINRNALLIMLGIFAATMIYTGKWDTSKLINKAKSLFGGKPDSSDSLDDYNYNG